MFDQSFSAHNFETIYGIESRKGNVEMHDMPLDYQDIVTKIQETKEEIANLKKSDEDGAEEKLQEKKDLLKAQEETKKKVLNAYLASLAKMVISGSFKFNLLRFVAGGKEIFTIDTTAHAQYFAVKQLQDNLRKSFKVCQANRHQILSNIKIFLNSKMPVYVIRTDVSQFYESIPQDRLMEMVTEDSILNHKSKAFVRGIIHEYEAKKNKALVPAGQGVPRGVGISSYLSEIYMRELDRELSSRREVIFYARYVDDIFMILSALPIGMTLNEYYDNIVTLFKEYKLVLKQPGAGNKCELIDMFCSSNRPQSTFNYLGYKIVLRRDNGVVSAKFQMKPDKVDAIKKKIDNAILHFNNLSVKNARQAYKDLIDSLDYITGNIALHKSKSGVKTGLYYSNDLLDEDYPDLKGLTRYLHSKSVSPSIKLNGYAKLQSRAKKHIDAIDFEKCWKDRKYNRFSIKRVEEMDSWL